MQTNAHNEDRHNGYVDFSVWGIGFTGGYLESKEEPPLLYTLFFNGSVVSWDNFSDYGIGQIDAAFTLAYEEQKANAY
jgi:hypothetical protein